MVVAPLLLSWAEVSMSSVFPNDIFIDIYIFNLLNLDVFMLLPAFV